MCHGREGQKWEGGENQQGKMANVFIHTNFFFGGGGGKKGGAVFVSCDLQSTSLVRKAQLNLFVLQEKKYSCTCLTIPYDMLVEFAERKY